MIVLADADILSMFAKIGEIRLLKEGFNQKIAMTPKISCL